jgi:type VI secretion system protein ImpA
MDYEQLISKVVDAENVCGSNLEDDASFQNFFFEAEGTPERFDGQNTVPAEHPDWRAIKKQALVFLNTTRDLKLISVLAQSVLNTEGIIKFEQCLNGIVQLLSNQWTSVFPPLDEDEGDPLERISALGHLSDQTFIISILKDTPITVSKVFGKVTLRLIDQAADNSGSKVDGALTLSQVSAVFNECDKDELTAMFNAINQSKEHLELINSIFIEQAGNNYNVSIDNVVKTFTHLSSTLEKYANLTLETEVSETVTSTSNEAETEEVKMSSNSQNSNSELSFQSAGLKLSSRQDVERCFDLICAYYTEYEPSSPIPVLINRSKKLVHMEFIDIVKEIMPDALKGIIQLGGIVEESTTEEQQSSSSASTW